MATLFGCAPPPPDKRIAEAAGVCLPGKSAARPLPVRRIVKCVRTGCTPATCHACKGMRRRVATICRPQSLTGAARHWRAARIRAPHRRDAESGLRPQGRRFGEGRWQAGAPPAARRHAGRAGLPHDLHHHVRDAAGRPQRRDRGAGAAGLLAAPPGLPSARRARGLRLAGVGRPGPPGAAGCHGRGAPAQRPGPCHARGGRRGCLAAPRRTWRPARGLGGWGRRCRGGVRAGRARDL
mmetsp:Transcript_100297/g.312511  ORF Transcript_100297/g.312511 Transcript_100297/m.312511 type:complete len:238 (+) Transcript_100297:727-1440(+)